MKNTLKVNHENRQIIMDRTFAKKSEVVGSEEYKLLQMARNDYPSYHVLRKTIKKNNNKQTYHGLTYQYMEEYILQHENAKQNFHEYEELRLISKCHSVRYPVIKKWFLNTYPEVAAFGISDLEETPDTVALIEKVRMSKAA